MTVSKINLTCWIVFIVMCIGFMPVFLGINAVHSIPAGPRVALSVVVVAILWWGPFGYAMYLSMSVIKNGDRRLLKRGIRGSALVLARKATNERIQTGGYAWQGSVVYKYRLRVSVPGKSPYETDCSICASGIGEGSTVDVAVSRHNHKRVTIDLDQVHKNSARMVGNPAADFRSSSVRFQRLLTQDQPSPVVDDRIDELTKLSRLHSQGDLTDAEFAAEKARILNQ